MEKERSKFPLHEAARLGNVTLVADLIRASPKEANRRDDDGRLPIHWATSSNVYSIIISLAQLPNFDPDVQDDSGWTPLMIAASVKDSDEILSLLLGRGCDVNQKSKSSLPLSLAGGHCRSTRSKTNKTGTWSGPPAAIRPQWPALHFLASKSNLDVARLLMEQQPPASTRIRDKRGQYPIHRAAAVGSGPMISLLVKHGSPVDATDNEGYTALHHAMAEGHGDAAVRLLKAGADPKKRTKEDVLAIDLAPDKSVRLYVVRAAEADGIDIN